METIKPNDLGGCTEDECPQYDGKRCRLIGFSVSTSSGCEPYVKRLQGDLSNLDTTAKLRTQERNYMADRARKLEQALEHVRGLTIPPNPGNSWMQIHLAEIKGICDTALAAHDRIMKEKIS